MFSIRRATAEDGPFLQAMLAIHWRPDAPIRSVAEVMGEPALARYVSGWPGDGEVGFVADDSRPLGAAWWRFFPANTPGYGFVHETIPEIAISLVADARGQGTGTLLLGNLIAEARKRSLPAVSLSVESENPATALYSRLGFVTTGRTGDAQTMVLELAA